MKTIIKTGTIILIVSILLTLGYMLISTAQRKKNISNAIQTIPDFIATDLNGNPFSQSDLRKNIPVIFTYFNSGCDFCQREAKDIRENIRLFNNVQLLFLSTELPDVIGDFAQAYDLADYSNIIFLHDANNKVANQFGISVIPTTLIYGKDLQLLRKYKGQIKAVHIIKELRL
ncbi:MAG: TlpA family protein disulfide reductase [Chitinophagaceae bacterium]|nr:TlpA family protein disulfide reductase [Chitinophagaceae bacterium]MCW5929819.1 TlpA family protein disulfide reductase [Chitinophagaceae bacterium]